MAASPSQKRWNHSEKLHKTRRRNTDNPAYKVDAYVDRLSRYEAFREQATREELDVLLTGLRAERIPCIYAENVNLFL